MGHIKAESVTSRNKSSRQFSEEEWERVREPFRMYYIDGNLSLKDAASRIRDHHNFDATLRQWERRLGPEKWNMPKYASRDDRLRVVSQNGTSLEDVSRRGRRKSTGSSEDNRLTVDRNMRRWARRELSRNSSRQRAKSVSEMSETSEIELDGVEDTQDHIMEDSSQTPSSQDWATPQRFHENESISMPVMMSDVDFVPQITFTDVDDVNVQSTSYDQTTGGFLHTPQIGGIQTMLPDPTFGFSVTQDHELDDPESIQPFPELETNGFAQREEEELSFFPQQRAPQLSYGGGGTDLVIDEIPDFDNTYTDVHNLLLEHHTNISTMIDDCIQSCENIGSNEVVMQILRLLQMGVQNQSESRCFRGE